MTTGTHLALGVLKRTGLSTLLALVLVGGLGTAAPGGHGTQSVDDAYHRVGQRAAADQRCSFQGFRRDAPAASALVRTPGGAVHVVSFEAGWDVFTGRHPGRLLAVCLDDRRPSPAS